MDTWGLAGMSRIGQLRMGQVSGRWDGQGGGDIGGITTSDRVGLFVPHLAHPWPTWPTWPTWPALPARRCPRHCRASATSTNANPTPLDTGPG